MLKKIIGAVIVIFVIYYLVSDPQGAGSTVHAAFNGLKSAGVSVTQFVRSL